MCANIAGYRTDRARRQLLRIGGCSAAHSTDRRRRESLNHEVGVGRCGGRIDADRPSAVSGKEGGAKNRCCGQGKEVLKWVASDGGVEVEVGARPGDLNGDC